MSDHTHTPSGRTRARGYGIEVFGTPGPWNAITDVPGVEVGLAQLIDGRDLCSGVTAIHPRGRGGTEDAVVAGWHSLNGNGELTGTTWISEAGLFNSPITISGTNAVGECHTASRKWAARAHPELVWEGYLPVCGETFDGWLNNPTVDFPAERLALEALSSASSGPVEEGSVGGGAGMICYTYKGGSGTASRVVQHADDEYVVGAWVQANFGSREELTVCGLPVGRDLLDDDPVGQAWADGVAMLPPGAGSVIVVIATNAPLLPGQCTALARRCGLGLGRTGTKASHYSGDIFLAFSTGNSGAVSANVTSSGSDYQQLRFIPWDVIDPFFDAVIQSTEEAVLNALCAAEETIGTGQRRVPAFPAEQVGQRVAKLREI